jgi:hypothetical protein
MVSWLNVVCLVLVTTLTALFYVRSAGPAALEQKIGPSANARCGRYRMPAFLPRRGEVGS